MSVWGAGVGFRFGVGPVAVGAVSGKWAIWFVWDHCGDSGFVFMLEPGVDVGLQVQTPIVVELNLELMTGTSITSFGGGCVSDLDGWGGGIDGGIKAIGDAEIGIDKSHDIVMVTLGAGLETGAGVSGGAHVTRKWFTPLKAGSCPCNMGFLEKGMYLLPGGSLFALGKAVFRMLQDDEEG